MGEFREGGLEERRKGELSAKGTFYRVVKVSVTYIDVRWRHVITPFSTVTLVKWNLKPWMKETWTM